VFTVVMVLKCLDEELLGRRQEAFLMSHTARTPDEKIRALKNLPFERTNCLIPEPVTSDDRQLTTYLRGNDTRKCHERH
jgi:hypothetical protein